ncbi:hypothetical protein [Paracidovorax sp. MALMAid1276]|uniref:hypothetical protein n=1 Tax=Paracidovorax sp. MALMAid1276 TaxID=3411631 RepID=UPI003B9C8F01
MGYKDTEDGAYAHTYLRRDVDELRGDAEFGDAMESDGQRRPRASNWRQEALRLLDEDYDVWRQERYEKFSSDTH